MPFGLKNAGATYQWLVTAMFSDLLGKTMEVYIDDMLVKSLKRQTHLSGLSLTFQRLRQYKMRLNPSKCAFAVTSGEFLGYLVTKRGIKANPDQIRALIEMPEPSTRKDKLARRVASLNQFISRSSDKCRPLFLLLKKHTNFEWTEECEQAFPVLKRYLSKPPILSKPKAGEVLGLYLAASDCSISSVLIRVEYRVEKPVYFVSRTLLD